HNAVTKPIFVSLYAPIDGAKEWLGVLQSVDDENIVLEVKEKSKTKQGEIPRSKIANARHAVMI
ncbi:ribosome maturation factor RimP, partial [Enterobacter mori]